ncbi:gamma-glutamyltransferase [Thermaurantiacus sp.]
MRRLAAILLLVLSACTAHNRAGHAPPFETQATSATYEPGGALAAAPATAATGAGVVSAADPRAAAAGAEMLAGGGTAADAAIATMIALTVVEPQSSGIGGGAFFLWHDPDAGGVITLDGRETAPAAARPDRFLKADGTPMSFREAVPGGRSSGVPGVIALAAEAHRRWGRLPWARLFAPAIRMAEEGVVLSERFVRFTAFREEMLQATPAGALFLAPDGRAWPAGHRLQMPELARTLREIASGGPERFYRGRIAEAVVRAVTKSPLNPGDMTVEDLARYRVTERPPVCSRYRRFRLCSMGPPSAGGIALLQILGQLERFDLKGLGPDNLLSWHLIAESMRLAFADREAWGGDADFAPVPVEGLLAPAYLASRSALIRIDRAMAEAPPGVPEGARPRAAQPLPDVPATSHLVAADAAGRIASVTSTLEAPFGSGLLAAGFLLNNELTDFDFLPTFGGRPAINRVEGGKRPRSSMTPTILFDQDGRALAAFGAAGGATIIAQVAKTVIAHVDWGLPIEAALAAPQIMADRRGVRVEAGSRLEGMVAGLRALGHADVAAATLPLKGNAVARDGARWRGAADPRSEGAALGVEVRP